MSLEIVPTLPHAEGPEKSILSSILQDPVEYLPRAVEMGIGEGSFYSPARGLLFSILAHRQASGQEIELVGLVQEMQARGDLEKIGGPASLQEIYTYAPTAAHFSAHAREVLDAAILRAIINFGSRIVSEAYQATDAADMVAQVELGALTIGREAEDRAGYDYRLRTAY